MGQNAERLSDATTQSGASLRASKQATNFHLRADTAPHHRTWRWMRGLASTRGLAPRRTGQRDEQHQQIPAIGGRS